MEEGTQERDEVDDRVGSGGSADGSELCVEGMGLGVGLLDVNFGALLVGGMRNPVFEFRVLMECASGTAEALGMSLPAPD